MTRDAAGELERRPAVSLAVAKRKGENAVIVADDVHEAARDDQGPHRSGRPRGRGHAQLRRDGQREGERAAVPSRARHRLDRHSHHRDDRLARGRRRADHHPDDDPADALRLLDDGLHDQPRQPVRAHLLDRHSRRRRDRRRREHRAPLVDARLARPCRDGGRGGGRGRQSDHRRDARHRRGAAADDVRQRPDGPLHEPDPGERLDRDAVLVLRRGDGDALAPDATRRRSISRGRSTASDTATTSARWAASTSASRRRC